MPPPDVAKRWTREDWEALPEDDGNRYELLDGELLMTPSPVGPHQRAVWALYNRIYPYVAEHGIGLTGLAPADLDFRSGQALQPDLFVVPLVEGREPVHWRDFGIPLLVVEVLSPSTAVRDRDLKRRKYQASGVGEYWVLDLDARQVERWRPSDRRAEILRERLEWQPDAQIPSLIIDMAALFREIWGEA